MTVEEATRENGGRTAAPDEGSAPAFGEFVRQTARLFGAFSRADFLARVREFLGALVGPVPYSLVSRAPDGGFRLEWSALAPPDWTALALPAVTHPLLVECYALGKPLDAPAGEAPPALELCGCALPLVRMEPLVAGGRRLGVIAFHAPPGRDRLGDAAWESALAAIGIALRKLLDHETNEEELESYRAKLEAINAVGELLGQLDLEVLLSKLMELALYVTSAQVGSIVFLDGDGYATRAEWGLSLEVLNALRLDGRPLIDEVAGRRQAVWIGAEERDRIDCLEPRVRVDSLISIPLVSEKRTLGAITLVNSADEDRELSRLDMEIVQTISGLAATAMENAILYAEAVEKERLEASLRIAQRIQAGLYPKRAPDVAGLEMGWISRSCEETGGDYFDFLGLGGGAVAVAVGDVAGHGLGAALLMASARAALRASTALSADLVEIVSHLNDLLERDMEVERFMTLFLAAIEPESGRIRYVNAGHDAPCIRRAGGGGLERLGATGMPLGIDRGCPFEAREARPLAPGDVLLAATDGIWEARDGSGAVFGKERVLEVIGRSDGRGAQEIADDLHAAFRAFVGSAPVKDDVTAVVVKRR